MSGISGDQELTADGDSEICSQSIFRLLHGVLISNLCALAVAATFLARFSRAVKIRTDLFIPTIKITFSTLQMQDTRLELPPNIDKGHHHLYRAGAG